MCVYSNKQCSSVHPDVSRFSQGLQLCVSPLIWGKGWKAGTLTILHGDGFLKVIWRSPGPGCSLPASQGLLKEAQKFSVCIVQFSFYFTLPYQHFPSHSLNRIKQFCKACCGKLNSFTLHFHFLLPRGTLSTLLANCFGIYPLIIK